MPYSTDRANEALADLAEDRVNGAGVLVDDAASWGVAGVRSVAHDGLVCISSTRCWYFSITTLRFTVDELGGAGRIVEVANADVPASDQDLTVIGDMQLHPGKGQTDRAGAILLAPVIEISNIAINEPSVVLDRATHL